MLAKIHLFKVMKMSKFLFLILFFFTTSSFASWKFLAENGGSKVYIESSSLKKSGSIVDVTWLSDMEPHTSGGRRGRPLVTITSIRFDSQLDCANRKYRIVNRSSYSDHLAVGYVDGEFVNGTWQDLKDMSLWIMVMNAVCK